MSSNAYDKLSQERKKMQAEGNMPSHWSTGSWQLFKEKYLYQAANPREQYRRIADTLATHTPDPAVWKDKFFDIMWKGWLSPSTPILANVGTTRGLPVSCAGSYFPDSIDGIYQAKHETAILTKYGFGTAGYLGDIRPRGSKISTGGKSLGVLPIIKGMQDDMGYVAQGTARRGSWAGYLPISHGDFKEVVDYLEQEPDGCNIGWNWYDSDTAKMDAQDEEMQGRFRKVLKTKMITGKGYFFFPDKVNRARPQWYIDHSLEVLAAQLCNEITLHSSKDFTYTCVLASMNLLFWNEWKNTDAVFVATVFLDCVAQEFIERAKNIHGLEKAVAFTKNSRALGLGVCGLHTLYQEMRLPFESFDAFMLNDEIFKHLRSEAERATKWSAEQWGEPLWCKGYGRANSHLLAVAPTKSTALIMGGVSEGINPDVGFVYTQRTPAGEIDRVNPTFLKLMKERGQYNKTVIARIRDRMGSVQQEDWLSEHEKAVFKTAFEIDQMVILMQAEKRGESLDQWQSLNLYIPAGEKEERIAKYHQYAVKSERIFGLYYINSLAEVQASKDECEACQ